MSSPVITRDNSKNGYVHVLLMDDVLTHIFEAETVHVALLHERQAWPLVCKKWRNAHRRWRNSFNKAADDFRVLHMDGIFQRRDISALLQGMMTYQADKYVQRVACIFLRLWAMPVVLAYGDIDNDDADMEMLGDGGNGVGNVEASPGSIVSSVIADNLPDLPQGILLIDSVDDREDNENEAESERESESGRESESEQSEIEGGEQDDDDDDDSNEGDMEDYTDRDEKANAIGGNGAIQAIVCTMKTYKSNVDVLTEAIEALMAICCTKENLLKLSAKDGACLIVSAMRVCMHSTQVLAKCISLLVNMCDGSDDITEKVALAGGISVVVQASIRHSKCGTLNRYVCYALWVLASRVGTDVTISLVEQGGMGVFIQCLRRKHLRGKSISTICRCIEFCVKNDENKHDFARRGGIAVLANVIRAYSQNPAVKQAAARALGELAWKHYYLWECIYIQEGHAVVRYAQHAARLRILADGYVVRV